ncbi:MAG: helix-turn-helix domain-containing protein [Desulfobacteraceae bacterium]
MNHFEILEVPANASSFEIKEAYKEALSIYSEDSLSTYSFFNDSERKTVLRKIEEAYSTLIDDKKRADYERLLVDEGKIDASILEKKGHKKAVPLFQTGQSKSRDAFINRIRNKVKTSDHDEERREILEKVSISGFDLEKLRESIGISLEEVFEITRINVSILSSVEKDEFEKLPAKIYLKSFIKSYAEVLQLDPERIFEAYIKNMNQVQSPS